MTIVLFLIDTSTSMSQKTYQGTSLLDTARIIVEQFLRQRGRDANARDRYMLMSFEEFPSNVKSGWREGQAIFQKELKSLKPKGTTTFGAALGSAFRFVNVNRMQTGIDNYGYGRVPFYIEPVIIISITDGASLTCPTSGVVNEISIAKPTAIGNELTEEPFRWDQRLYAIVLRLSGSLPSNAKIVSGMNIPFDNSPIDAMCAATGGRSFCITSHKMLGVCVDTIVQKMQQHGALVHFQQVGADPAPPISERINGAVENGVAKRNGEVEGMSKKSVTDDGGWRNVLTTISSRVSSRSYLGNWPIPEVFWPDKNMMSLPPRKAHPTIMFRCDDCDPLVCQEFPFDKYELEPSPLTQFILERKQPNVCWQVFVANSSQPGTNAAPFGYLKAATNLQSVNLFLMPYNYPILLPLVEEIKQDPRLRTNQAWKLRLEKYIASAPCYYLAPLKKAFQRFNVTTSTLESDHSSQYSYNVLSYITKMKHTAREEFESNCTTVASALQQPANLPSNMTSVPQRPKPRGTTDASASLSKRPIARASAAEVFSGYQIQISESKTRSIPSIKFRNPFEIKRSQLIDQVEKMRINLGLHLRDTNVSALIGGKPGTNIKLHHAEDLHNLPVREMGEYQEYLKGLEAIGRAPPRDVEPQTFRPLAFGNPFKVDKKSIAVDEVGEGNILGVASKGDTHKKRSNSSSVTSQSSSRPPRRKPGPLARNALSLWRMKRREGSMSSTSSACSTVTSSSDLDSVSSLYDDLSSVASSSSVNDELESVCERSGREVSSKIPLLNGHASEKRPSDRVISSELAPPLKKLRSKQNDLDSISRLDCNSLSVRKRNLGSLVRRRLNVKETISEITKQIDGLCVWDCMKCVEYSMREAKRFKRNDLVETINNVLVTSFSSCNNST